MTVWLLTLALTTTPQIDRWVGKTRTFAANDEQYVYRVEKDDVVLDFKGGCILSGKPLNPDQNSYTGTGLLIKDRKNVTIKNLRVSGYRFNFRIVNSSNIRLENCSADGSRSLPILRSGTPVDTFLDIRNIDIWRTYGAGFWIENCQQIVVKKSHAKGSQNGIVLVATSGATIIENDFSFNSGWGIALGKSSQNNICWNRADFVNRPWSGFWGGDSAALAVADGSQENYIVGNSLTHSGDGFFLTHRGDRFLEKEGKIELDGPSNNNVIAYNDGSWSTANAFEGTFSSGNVYFKNWANDSAAAGFWLGYSDDSLVLDNEIRRNGNDGVAIEHGLRNVIAENVIEGSRGAGVALWTSSDWKRLAKPSGQNDLVGNRLRSNGRIYRLDGTTSPFLKDDLDSASPSVVDQVPRANHADRLAKFEHENLKRIEQILAMKPKNFRYYRDEIGPRGFNWIQPDEYAPRDFSNDLVAWRQPDPGSIEMYLRSDGVRVSIPPILQFDPTPEDPRLVRISARQVPGEVGGDIKIGIGLSNVGSKAKQQVATFLRTAIWQVKWFDWAGIVYDDAEAWKKLFESDALAKQTTRLLGGDYSGRSPMPGLPAHHFACIATTKVKLESGRYTFSCLSDDGIRVFVDGHELISRWNHHGPTPDEAAISLTAGVHTIRVQYCQESGAAVLRVDWRRSG